MFSMNHSGIGGNIPYINYAKLKRKISGYEEYFSGCIIYESGNIPHFHDSENIPVYVKPTYSLRELVFISPHCIALHILLEVFHQVQNNFRFADLNARKQIRPVSDPSAVDSFRQLPTEAASESDLRLLLLEYLPYRINVTPQVSLVKRFT